MLVPFHSGSNVEQAGAYQQLVEQGKLGSQVYRKSEVMWKGERELRFPYIIWVYVQNAPQVGHIVQYESQCRGVGRS